MRHSLSHRSRLQLAPAATGFVLTALSALTPSYAYEFEMADGEIQGSWKNTISLGARYDLKGYETPDQHDVSKNDGPRSFDGGFVSKVIKLTSELELKKDNYGLFVRGTAFRDDYLMDSDNNRWESNNADDLAKGMPDQAGTYNGWSDDVLDNQGQDAKIQQAFVYGNWTFSGGQELSLTLGDQVLNWGENIFYPGGLRDLDAHDLAVNSLPGSSGDLGVGQGALSGTLKINDEWALSAFVQYDWEETSLMGRGTFETQTELFVAGSEDAYYPLSSFGLNASQTAVLDELGVTALGDFVRIARVDETTEARNSGQWGTRLTFTPEFLPNTEMSLYFANYHSSIPFSQAYVSSDQAAYALGLVNANSGAVYDYLSAVETAFGARSRAVSQVLLASLNMHSNGTRGRTVYPEDIKLWGGSFHTKVFGYTQIAGELTYRENAPIWRDHPEDLVSVASGNLGSIAAGSSWNGSLANPDAVFYANTWNDDFERVPMWDGSLSVIQPLGAVMGTDLMYVVGETAFQVVSGIDDYDRYQAKGSDPWYFEDNPRPTDGPADERGERLDRLSWGYNLLVGANWNNVAPGLNVKSTMRFSYDVSGNSHLTGRFEEGQKRLSIGVTGEYKDFVAKLGLGGKAKNLLRKGNITTSVSYQF